LLLSILPVPLKIMTPPALLDTKVSKSAPSENRFQV
jgi:hypothetical protein